MSKRLRNLALLGAAILITVSTVSFGYFYFGGDIKTSNQEAINNFKVDDIYENYKTIAEKEGNIDLDDQRYDIYIYPSAEYLQIYNNYLTAVEERLNNSYPTTIPTDKQVALAKKDQDAYSKSLITQAMPGESAPIPLYTPLYRPSPESFNGSLEVSYKDDGDIIRDPNEPDEPLLRFNDNNPISINNAYRHKDFRNGTTEIKNTFSKLYSKAQLTEAQFEYLVKNCPENQPYKADMYVQYLNDNYIKMFNGGDLVYKSSSGIGLDYVSPTWNWRNLPFAFYPSITASSIILKGEESINPYPYYKKTSFSGDLYTNFNEWYKEFYWDDDILVPWKNFPDYTPTAKEWDAYRIMGNAGFQRNIYRIYNYYACNYGETYRTYGSPHDKSFSRTYPKTPSNEYPLIVKNYINLFRDTSASEKVNGSYTEITKYDWDDGEQDNGMALYADDRFGCWKSRSLEEGRFSPIHLKVTNTLTPQVFSKAFGTLMSTMNDGNKQPWFAHTFDNFVYAKTEGVYKSTPGNYKFKKSFPLKNLASSFIQYGENVNQPDYDYQVNTRDLMGSCDMDNIFDITKPLSEYADENNIIRLFPVFSSGKGYYSIGYKEAHKSDADVDSVARSLGGKDQIVVNINHSIQLPNRPEPYVKHFSKNPVYLKRDERAKDYYPFGKKVNASDPDPNKGKHFTIYCGYLSSVPINIYTLKTDIDVSVHVSNGPGGWGGSQPHPYTINFGNPEAMKLLPGSGYYNIYFFIGNSGHACTPFTPDQIPDPTNPNGHKVPRIDDYFNTSKQQETNFLDAFPQLKDKRLISIPCKEGVVDYYDGQKPVTLKDGRGNHINQRPIHVMIEKATEPKLYLNTDSKNHTLQEIDDLAIEQHDIAPTGYRFTRPTFAIDDNKQVKQVYGGQAPGEPMRNKNLYYLFKNVDFTDVNNNDFFLRFGHTFDKNIIINPVSEYKNVYISKASYPFGQNPKIPTVDEINAKNGNFARFWPAFGPGGKGNFFTLNTKKVEYKGETVDRQYMSLNSDENRGVYDIIFVKRDSISNAQNSNIIEFDMYTYRHTNIFVKLFRNDLTSYGPGDPSNPSSSTAQFIQHRNAEGLLFDKKCFIGDVLDNNERSDIHVQGANGLNIDEIIRANIQKWHDEDVAKYNPSDPNAAAPIDFSNLVIRDHVTGAPVIWYNPKNGQRALRTGDVNPLDGTQFEIFYDPHFIILKNHILYISTKGKL